MSGSGGGGYVPPQRLVFDCDTSVIITFVSSVNLDALSKRKVDDLLNVEKGLGPSLLLIDGNGETLGAVLHTNTKDILDCINNGHMYKARILSISTPVCKVQISRKII